MALGLPLSRGPDMKQIFFLRLLLSSWPCESRLGSALLNGTGRHLLQMEWRHGRSLGSLLWKLNLQMGHVSISPKVPGCFNLSSSAGKLSASFSTIMTMSSFSTFWGPSSIFYTEPINTASRLETKATL